MDMEPTELTMQLLEDITDGFSEQRKLGQGGYGTVYRGKFKNGQEVAVKLFHNFGPGLQDAEFKNEFDNLMKLNHQNIMKLIGYCYETKHKLMEYHGKNIFAEMTYRALCLEYLHCGSLQNFLSEGICDGRLDWHTCFKIIEGACEGLKYLHEELQEPIYHLDLKPDNILLDMNMVPKLADFGLSKIFSGEQTRMTHSCTGTAGYMPPEYIEKGVISKKFDIYSMGVVMIKTISGSSGHSRSSEMSAQEFINLVQNTWRVKLQEKWSGSSLEAYCHQVKRCTEIALNCVAVDRHKRPNILAIVNELSELERAADEISSCPGGELLSFYPFQLVFPFKSMTPMTPKISCPLYLKNNTDDIIYYRLRYPNSVDRLIPNGRYIGKTDGCVLPRTTHTYFLTALGQAANMYEFFTFESWRREDEVHVVKVIALHEPPNTRKTASKSFLAKGLYGYIKCMDVHPTEPWILVDSRDIRVFGGGYYGIKIYNYETHDIETVNIDKKEQRSWWNWLHPNLQSRVYHRCVTSVKFIAQKKWFAAGDNKGSIYIFRYDPAIVKIHHLKRAHSKSIDSLAIHPDKPYLLSASKDGYINLWDFENRWNVKRVFGHFVFPWQNLNVHQRLVLINPNDASIFVSIQDNRIKIWNLNCSQSIFASAHTTIAVAATVCLQCFEAEKYEYNITLALHCLNYFSRGNELFLIGGFVDGIIKIWDSQTMECVKTLETPYGAINAACSDPNLPILVTGSGDGTVCLWNSTTFKIERTLNFGLGSVNALECLKGSRRMVILHDGGIALTEIESKQTGGDTEGLHEQDQEESIVVDT